MVDLGKAGLSLPLTLIDSRVNHGLARRLHAIGNLRKTKDADPMYPFDFVLVRDITPTSSESSGGSAVSEGKELASYEERLER